MVAWVLPSSRPARDLRSALQAAVCRRDGGKADATALLRGLDRAKSEFFEAVRGGTITGFLADPEYGRNTGKVGWTLIGFEDRFAWSAPFGWYDADASRGQ